MSLSQVLLQWITQPVLAKLTEMEKKIMAQIDDLKAAIDSENVQIQTLVASVTKIASDVDSLVQKLANVPLPPDLTQQISDIQAHTAALKTATDQLASADTEANPPPAQ